MTFEGLDAYIQGLNDHRPDEERRFQCSQCGLERTLSLTYDLGRWYLHLYSEDLAWCESCDEPLKGE